MRIMQAHSYIPIKQNRMVFRGEEKELSLSEQIKKVKAEQEDKGLFAQAETAYLKINGKASERIFSGSTTEADIDAFVDSGVAYVRSIIAVACKQDRTKQLVAAEKIGNASKAFSMVGISFPKLAIANPIAEVLVNLPIIFRKVSF